MGQVICRQCGGSGAENPDDVQQCPVCSGSGVKIVTKRLGPGFVQQMQTTCDKCGGKGQIVSSTCPVCKGKKVVNGENELFITIERGMPDGHKMVFHGEADQGPEINPGDVVFAIRTAPHPQFRRDANQVDLHYIMHITLLEALVGFEKEVTHLDGHAVTVKRSKVTRPRQVVKIKAEGMPRHEYPSEFGDLYVEFRILMPTTLTAAQKDGARELLAGMWD